MIKISKIIYTLTDEAPALATYSLLPIIRAFTHSLQIFIETHDISLSGRILSNFPEYLHSDQCVSDHLTELSHIVFTPQANIIKLPNISASLPQLKAAIQELQEQGYLIPDYIEKPKSYLEKEIKSRYDKIKGSAVNPILREGNSDRRVPSSVKNYIRKHPHHMGAWTSSSLSHVSYMQKGDFYSTEKSVLITHDNNLSIIFIGCNGTKLVLKDKIFVNKDEIIDAAVMNKKAFRNFIAQQIIDAKKKGVLLSLHLKATMMKVSDPIMFGIVVSEFYKDVLTRFNDKITMLGFDANNGINDLYSKIRNIPNEDQYEIIQAINATYIKRPSLAMVNVEKGVTNLHVPNGIIIDASMPEMIRNSGKMWGSDGQLHDTKAIIPDRCYAGVYQAVIENCKQYGAFDPRTIGSIPNIGLMAQQAEEYGSHDKTFQIPFDGVVQVIDDTYNVLLTHQVEEGDIWRMCQTKDIPIQNWVKLAVHNASKSNTPTIFWLDSSRAHDVCMIKKVQYYLQNFDKKNLDIRIMSPIEATQFSINRARRGKDTISVTGNVLRDYLTDLFPILELGTSSKILSIVPLISGGGLFETGAGGSAPKHVQQFLQENHLRWDSLGEFLALTSSLEYISIKDNNNKAKVLSNALDQAIEKILDANKCPSKETGKLDSRGSHFYLALFWAQMLSKQNYDLELQKQFSPIASVLLDNEQKILVELNQVQGQSVDIGGYYHPNPLLTCKAMRPSTTFNALLKMIDHK